MKNFFKFSLLGIIAVFLLFSSIKYQNQSATVPQEDKTRSLSSIKSIKKSPALKSPPKEEPTVQNNDKYSDVFENHLPRSLDNEEWAHKIKVEDESYVSTILTIETKDSNDPKELDTYLYRWRKENGTLVLAAGEIPKPLRIEGSFPNDIERVDIIKNLERPDLKILKSYDVWDLSYDNILRPSIKIEVEYEKLNRHYHEFWYLNPETNIVTQIRPIDRH